MQTLVVLAMDSRKIIELLRGTIDPNQRIAAEEQLKQVTAKFQGNILCTPHFSQGHQMENDPRPLESPRHTENRDSSVNLLFKIMISIISLWPIR